VHDTRKTTAGCQSKAKRGKNPKDAADTSSKWWSLVDWHGDLMIKGFLPFCRRLAAVRVHGGAALEFGAYIFEAYNSLLGWI
jgi:hypothetical protein